MTIAGLPLDPMHLAAPHWLRPQWLWLLLALPLLGWWWQLRQRARSAWRSHVDPHLLPRLLDDASGRRAPSGRWLALLGGALAVCALAGPSWQKTPQALWQARMPLVIALDLSNATLAPDLPPSRLLQARAKIARLLATRAGGQVGLVAFADDAFTVAPLTDDAANVALFLDALAPDVMPLDGSRADRAVAWSARLLRQAGFSRGDILVLSDHADAAAREAAASARSDGYRVSVLGLGTASGAAYRDVDGRIGQAHLDPDSLRALAAAGGGAYASLGAGDGDLDALGVLDPQRAADDAASGAHAGAVLWRDQGYWLLLPLLVLGVFAFRRGVVLAALVAVAWLPWQPAQASGFDWWQRPDQRAHEQLQLGAQAYRQHDYALAAAQWRTLPGADAAYNLGNALAEQGEYDAAIDAYDRALQLDPRMADAATNRQRVLAAKRRQQQQQGRSPPSGQGKPGQSQSGARRGAQQPGPQSGQAGAQGQPQPSAAKPPASSRPQQAQQQGQQQGQQTTGAPSPAAQRDPSASGQAPAAPASPGDPGAQRQADAAQRQRMQQALQQAAEAKAAQAAAAKHGTGDRQPAAAAQTAGETQAQRERRIANEAWLRRVPDDPGGLLRAKFRLEYERRQQEGERP